MWFHECDCYFSHSPIRSWIIWVEKENKINLRMDWIAWQKQLFLFILWLFLFFTHTVYFIKFSVFLGILLFHWHFVKQFKMMDYKYDERFLIIIQISKIYKKTMSLMCKTTTKYFIWWIENIWFYVIFDLMMKNLLWTIKIKTFYV